MGTFKGALRDTLAIHLKTLDMCGPRWRGENPGLTVPLTNFSRSFRHGNRHCLAGAAFGDPDRVARGLDCGWCFETFFDYVDAGFIAIDSNHGNFAAAILCNEQLAIGGAHAVRPFYGLIHPDIDRVSGLAGRIHRDTVEIVREHIVDVQSAIQKGDAEPYLSAGRGNLLGQRSLNVRAWEPGIRAECDERIHRL
jgi:hypothetical protein